MQLAEEERDIRRRSLNPMALEGLPAKLKVAVLNYVEYGDRWVASRIAGLTVDEFTELLRKLGVAICP